MGTEERESGYEQAGTRSCRELVSVVWELVGMDLELVRLEWKH